MLFLNQHYAQAQSPAYAGAPRAFLLALTRLAPPHALLVAYWGADGAAALSVPTREYFQSSGWSAPPTPATSSATSPSSSLSTTTTPSTTTRHHPRSGEEAQSVRSGSGFWAAGHDSSQGSSAFSHTQMRQLAEQSASTQSASAPPPQACGDNDSGDDSDGTEIAGGSSNDGSRAQGPAGQPAALGTRGKQQAAKQRVDDVGAQDAFIAGMIYALSRRLLPGAPYVPGLAVATEPQRTEGGRWKLDECLRCELVFSVFHPRLRGVGVTNLIIVFVCPPPPGSRRSSQGARPADVHGMAWVKRWLARVGSTRDGWWIGYYNETEKVSGSRNQH